MIDLHHGDCLDIMPTLEAESVDTVICDPPYALTSFRADALCDCKGGDHAHQDGDPLYICERDGVVLPLSKLKAGCPVCGQTMIPVIIGGSRDDCPKCNGTGRIQPKGGGFMGKAWDNGIPGPRFWREALRVAKPGAMLLAFGGTRTFHRLACAIEDAGWELRDTVMWVYGSGFPKSHDISKAIDKAAGAERETLGVVTRTPSNGNGATVHQSGGDKSGVSLITTPATPAAETWHGWGTALKPAWEPIIVAMKPLDGTFAQNALQHGVAGLWIDGARVGTEQTVTRRNGDSGGNGAYGRDERVFERVNPPGRWPANLIHDGSDEVLAGFPVTGASGSRVRNNSAYGGKQNGDNCYGDWNASQTTGYDDTGSAARFFYCAKASRSERNAGLEGMEARGRAERDGRQMGNNSPGSLNGSGKPVNGTGMRQPAANHHPTVKPIALMRYLARLTKTPTGGVVLDPFMGSGSTGIGAVMEGRDFIGIEQDADYIEIARRRIEHWQAEAEREAAQLELQFD